MKKYLSPNTSLLKNVTYPDKIPPLVKVTWIDAITIGGAGWMSKDEAKAAAKEPLPIMITVGFELYSDEEQLAITNTVGPVETAQVNKIPKRMILKVEAL